MATCLLSCDGLFMLIRSCFTCHGMITDIVYLVKHPNFDIMHNISFFSRIVFGEFIAKGGK
jgi:hypothetical protein